MGLFFNYDKPGPGVDKDAPKKKGVFLYFELLRRNLSKLLLSNMLYFVVSLPVAVLYFMVISYFLGIATPEIVGTVTLSRMSVILTLLTVIFWGTGPVSCGFTYILRNIAREEHTFVFSDFLEKSRQSFLHGLVFLAIDIIMFISSTMAIWIYKNMAEKSGGIYVVLFATAIITLVLYTIMHFYMYEFEVTFKNSILQIYKNSFIMAFATLPMCLLIGFIICAVSIVLLGILNPIIVLIVAFLCWVSVMRFVVDFYSARIIKRTILAKYEKASEVNRKIV